MDTPIERPLLDLVSSNELARAWRDHTDSGWEPDAGSEERRRWRPSLRPVLKYLPWVMLPLGLLAIVGLAAAVQAMSDGSAPSGFGGWLRFGLLLMASAFVVVQAWSLVSKTKPVRALRSKWAKAGVRPPTPLLDGTPLHVLRSQVGEGWGEPGRGAVLAARGKRFAGSWSWWALVALALVLSAAIVVAMLGLAAWRLAQGTEVGPWLALVLMAAAFSALGFWMSLRTAVRSRTDLRQRRRLRLFRRVLAYIARGWGFGRPGGSGSAVPAGGALPGGMVAGSVRAVAMGGAVPGRLLRAGDGVAKIAGGQVAAFAAASLVVAWAGLAWPGGAPAGDGPGGGGDGDGSLVAPGEAVAPTAAPSATATATTAQGAGSGETPATSPVPGEDTPTPTATPTPANVTNPGGSGQQGAGGISGGGGGAATPAPTNTSTATPTATNTPPPTNTPTATPTLPLVQPPPPTATPTSERIAPPPPPPTDTPPAPPERTPDPPQRTPTPEPKPTATNTPTFGGPSGISGNQGGGPRPQ